MQLQQDTTAITIDRAVWVIGPNDICKGSAICRLIQEIKPEPSSEIFVLDAEYRHHEFYAYADIPIAHDISQIAQILNNLIQEFRDRQVGKIGTQIICCVEIDSLQAALKQRATELRVAYEPQELATIVEVLQDSDCAKVGIYMIFSVDSKDGLLGENDLVQMYCGEAAVSFTSDLDDRSYDAICRQRYPCCFYVDGIVQPVLDATKGNVLSLEQIYRKEYICRNQRVLDSMGDRESKKDIVEIENKFTQSGGVRLFHRFRSLIGGR